MPVISETTISELDLSFEHLFRVFSVIDLVCDRVARPFYIVADLFVRPDYFFNDEGVRQSPYNLFLNFLKLFRGLLRPRHCTTLREPRSAYYEY